MCDDYAVIKGKALTMVREFVKVYPGIDHKKLCDRITKEVIFAAYECMGNEFSRSKIQQIYREVYDNVRV